MARDSVSIKKSDELDEFEKLPEMQCLTAKQAAFVREFTCGKWAGNGPKSVLAAGYDAKDPWPVAWALERHPKVIAAIDAAVRSEISQKLTITAIRLIGRVLQDDNAPLKIRSDMAIRVVEVSGIAHRIGVEKAHQTGLNSSDNGPKRLGEMTRTELEAIVQSGAAILQAAATLPPQTIEATPSDTAKEIRRKPGRPRKSLMVTTS